MNALPRFRHCALAAAVAVLAAAATLGAHDFWLVPGAFQVTPGGWIAVRGQTSSRFPTSDSAVALDRVAEARVLSAGEEAPIRDLSHVGTSLRLRHRPTAAGQRIVAVTLRPRPVRESPEGFRRYLTLEGAPEALARYEREGRLPQSDSVTRRYAKYAKTFVEVGRPADAGSGADWDAHWATLVWEVPQRGTGMALGRPAATAGAQSDSAAVAAVVERYHRALASGDSAAALALLAPDAVILESGGVETRAEYRSHHLPADIEFARAVPSQRGPVRVRILGDVAWATSTSTTEGEFRGRAVNSAGAELMVLTRSGNEWRIEAIHWSSRTRR